ncbi:hypothetical protein Ocin01_01708, partial [Orchesella cincta]
FQTALSSDLKRPGSSLETARMSQLETLEAKMASIEVSLSKLGALPRRKRNGILPGVARSLHNSHMGSMNGSVSAHVTREFHKEIDFLKHCVRDKENLILK